MECAAEAHAGGAKGGEVWCGRYGGLMWCAGVVVWCGGLVWCALWCALPSGLYTSTRSYDFLKGPPQVDELRYQKEPSVESSDCTISNATSELGTVHHAGTHGGIGRQHTQQRLVSIRMSARRQSSENLKR